MSLKYTKYEPTQEPASTLAAALPVVGNPNKPLCCSKPCVLVDLNEEDDEDNCELSELALLLKAAWDIIGEYPPVQRKKLFFEQLKKMS